MGKDKDAKKDDKKDKKDKGDKDKKDKDKKDKHAPAASSAAAAAAAPSGGKRDKKKEKADKKAAQKAAKANSNKKSAETAASSTSFKKISPNVGTQVASANTAAGGAKAAWAGAGTAAGLQIWRVEQFKIVPWPQNLYGQFHMGDSYIVLHTQQRGSGFAWDVYFWLGTETSQDEAGTAAYKTVELDDVLGGAPVQHREVMGHESPAFLALFAARGGVIYLEGGVATGFKHVEKAEIKRLLHLKGQKSVRVSQVPLEIGSLNEGDVFVLDTTNVIFLWFGKTSSKAEQLHAWTLAKSLKGDRGGKPEIVEVRQGEKEQAGMFSQLAGEEDDILDADEAGSDNDAAAKQGTKKLFKVSDATGTLVMTPVAEGAAVKKAMLNSNDVFILDSGFEIYTFVGKASSAAEKRGALGFAQDYLEKSGLPAYTPITRIVEGCDSAAFEALF